MRKRIGTALHTLIAKHKGSASEALGGKGKFTGDLITKLSAYYGWALKSKEGNVKDMRKAVMATYRHITFNDKVSDHSLCPSGPSSWCRQNAAQTKNEPIPKHRYNLPSHVCKALRPVYECLSEEKLLERCQHSMTQNNNECLHSMIWALAPKEQHASLFADENAVAEAVMKFNSGNERTASAILQELHLSSGLPNSQRMAEKGNRRAAASAHKHASAENLQQTFKKRLSGSSQQRLHPWWLLS